jgi:hypothetical protein
MQFCSSKCWTAACLHEVLVVRHSNDATWKISEGNNERVDRFDILWCRVGGTGREWCSRIRCWKLYSLPVLYFLEVFRVTPTRTKKLVISSAIRMCGFFQERTARETRDFWPPESVPMRCRWYGGKQGVKRSKWHQSSYHRRVKASNEGYRKHSSTPHLQCQVPGETK